MQMQVITERQNHREDGFFPTYLGIYDTDGISTARRSACTSPCPCARTDKTQCLCHRVWGPLVCSSALLPSHQHFPFSLLACHPGSPLLYVPPENSPPSPSLQPSVQGRVNRAFFLTPGATLGTASNATQMSCLLAGGNIHSPTPLAPAAFSPGATFTELQIDTVKKIRNTVQNLRGKSITRILLF